MWRRRAHWVVLKKGWDLTSDAPALDPNRLFSSFTRSFRIKDLHKLSLLLVTRLDQIDLLESQCLLRDLRGARVLRESNIIPKDVGKGAIPILAFEGRSAIEHLIY